MVAVIICGKREEGETPFPPPPFAPSPPPLSSHEAVQMVAGGNKVLSMSQPLSPPVGAQSVSENCACVGTGGRYGRCSKLLPCWLLAHLRGFSHPLGVSPHADNKSKKGVNRKRVKGFLWGKEIFFP